MQKENFIILNHQDSFADILTTTVYGKILERLSSKKCVFENISPKREMIENLFNETSLKFDYLSTYHIESIKKKAVILNNKNKLSRTLRKKNFHNKNYIIDIKKINLKDLEFFTDETKKLFTYKNINFIVNFDILESIINSNSIGIYIDKKDKNNINCEFLTKAILRLNKYIKQPRIFIFCSEEIKPCLDLAINCSIITLADKKEEFYFLVKCKYKIILNLKNSYSPSLLAMLLNKKDYRINIIQKENNSLLIF